MNNSQQQSLDETVVFSPLTESSPDFLHSEAQRCALEHLLTSGPGAFYTKLSKEGLLHFLSPEEVNQVAGWAEDYRISEVLLDNENPEEESESGTQGYSVQYFPVHSDTPAPSLELGWPEEARLEGVDQAVVYTSPPAEQMPHIREVVRRLLQGASTLIAIVTDRVTDNAVIGDLHCAASRGVPVYIILNRRSVQENSRRLRHPNIRVRTAGGKTFYSRDGKMVVGELKENFILVDLKTVVLGSYSLTWTDAHLHRQLITVLSGPGVMSFDREFRILYAASLPIPDLWKSGRPVGVPNSDANNLYQPEYLEQLNQKISLMDRPYSPPPPPTDCSVDWEAMGVIQWNEGVPDDLGDLPRVCEETPQSHREEFNGQPGVAEAKGGESEVAEEPGSTDNQVEDKSYPSVKAELRQANDHHTQIRLRQKAEITPYRRLSLALETEREDWDSIIRARERRMDINQNGEPGNFPWTHKRDYPSRMDQRTGDKRIPDDTPPQPATAENNHKKPLILRVPQMESFSSLSDILRKMNAGKSGKEQQKRTAKTTISKSMLDLSAAAPDTSQNTSGHDGFPLTPALALIKKRNDEIKSGLLRAPRTFLPPSRPRSSSFGLQREPWRAPFIREQRADEDK